MSPAESAWDRLLDLVDHLSASPERALPDGLEETFAGLCQESIADGIVDSELHPRDSARWLVGLVHARRTLTASHPQVPSDTEDALLRVILTRWLHPVRPR